MEMGHSSFILYPYSFQKYIPDSDSGATVAVSTNATNGTSSLPMTVFKDGAVLAINKDDFPTPVQDWA